VFDALSHCGERRRKIEKDEERERVSKMSVY